MRLLHLHLHLLFFAAAGVAGADQALIYPYSVIPGGITSDDDFEVKRPAEYADVGFLRATYQSKDEVQYASYVRFGRMFWTRVQLHAGELVWIDRYGNRLRGRCGNRLSPAPQTPIEFKPPPPEVWDHGEIVYAVPPVIPPAGPGAPVFPWVPPDAPPLTITPLPPPLSPPTTAAPVVVPVLLWPPEIPPAILILPPIVVGLLPPGGPAGPGGFPVGAVPEPATTWLIIVGVIGLAVLKRRPQRRPYEA